MPLRQSNGVKTAIEFSKLHLNSQKAKQNDRDFSENLISSLSQQHNQFKKFCHSTKIRYANFEMPTKRQTRNLKKFFDLL